MKNKFLLVVLLLLATITIPQKSFAKEHTSQPSATIKLPEVAYDTGSDYRVKVLTNYLKKYNSPMADNAEDFVNAADKYELDWRLVAAISGVESSYGLRIPPYSYNGWGWGVYGDNVIRFSSWKNGIETVSQGLRERYMDQWGGETIDEIGARYAASPHWSNSVNIHLNMMQRFILANPQDTLSLSL
jgi:hypothetical protein